MIVEVMIEYLLCFSVLAASLTLAILLSKSFYELYKMKKRGK